ncbi:MAG: adenosylmethionine--8-amino-7-oxononanoate transaminase [Deltaproteobacteria bacterium]|nr:MAG: adenosylmethionine--8-amino-7-oxononanoate transaminase [Deltaproteobacteria bacterium]
MTNEELAKQDLGCIFHPCSQMKDYENYPIIPIKRGYGAYIEDFEGRAYLDCISSWWVNLFGHANEEINAKITKQLGELEHVIFAGFTHEPALKLSRRLLDLSGFDKLFFADNGSSAVEVALKMAYQFFANRGEQRPLFVSLSNSYHGETMGALAVSDTGLYKDIYSPILLQTLQAASPALVSEDEAIASMKDLLRQNANKVASVIVEPLVQCAGGMLMYDASYLKRLKSLCEEEGVFLICDEIAVGFGRTGSMFAYEQAGIKPDLVCLSKGITAGYLPLSVVLMRQEMYDAFYDDYEKGRSFMHSHSYTANALACAAANACLDIFERDNIIETNKAKIALIASKLEGFRGLKNVLEVRQRGMIAAVELKNPLQKRISLEFSQNCMKEGVYLRPLGNVVYFMPPYIFTSEQLHKMLDVAKNAIETLDLGN